MTISKRIRSELFASSAPAPATEENVETMLIRLPLSRPLPGARKRPSRAKKSGLLNHDKRGLGWSDEEHERFLRGLEKFPTGPWKVIATFVETRTTRQVMTHAQKYRQKIARRQRGLQTQAQRKPAPVVSCVQSSCGDDDNDETMDTPTTTTASPAEVVQDVKTEKVNLSTRHPSTIATCEPSSSSKSLSATSSSPSSTDHTTDAFDYCYYSSTANATRDDQSATFMDERSLDFINSCFLPLVEMVDDRLCVEALWVNHQFDGCDDIRLMDDPLALMFQDPSTFIDNSSQHSSNKSAVLSMDVVYPVAAATSSAWTPAVNHYHSVKETSSSYLCQL